MKRALTVAEFIEELKTWPQDKFIICDDPCGEGELVLTKDAEASGWVILDREEKG